MKVSARVTKGEEGVSTEAVSCDYDFGENVAEMTSKFGEEVIFTRARASLVIDLQAFIRRAIANKKTDAEIQEAVSAWVPGVKAAGKSPAEKLKALLEGKSSEEVTAILQESGILDD